MMKNLRPLKFPAADFRRSALDAARAFVAISSFAMPVLLSAQELANTPSADASSLELRQESGDVLPPGAEDYDISTDDLVEIFVVGIPEISRLYRVSPSGQITLALLREPVMAAGRTTAELAKVVSEKLQAAGMVTNPHLTVQLKESRVHSIAITGAVKKPQVYPLFGGTTLLDALSQAGGLAEDAGNTAILTRGGRPAHGLEPESQARRGDAATSTSAKITVNLRQLLEEGDSGLNLDLYPGDRVTVQRAGIVYVVGAVNRAGGFVLKDEREQMTVLKAIALAESLKPTADPNKSLIIRKNPQMPGASEDIHVDLTRILSGHTPDRPLLASDILFVPDSTARRALHRAGEAAAQAAALFIYRVP